MKPGAELRDSEPCHEPPHEQPQDAATSDRSTVSTPVDRFTAAESAPAIDILAVEEPLECRLVYGPAHRRQVKSISVTMRTPGHDFEWAAGFLMTEGVIADSADILNIGYLSAGQSEPNVVRVELAPGVSVSLANLERNFYTTSSCGICGKASLLALRSVCPPRFPNQLQMPAALLYQLPARLLAAQDVFARTGGLHAAGLFDSSGRLLLSREDVGRHNAVDKLLGAEFLAGRTPLRDRLLVLSGRASFELLQKALMAGIPMVVSVGAPSSLAVRVAKEFDISLVGFLRADRFNVYHGASRIL